MIILNFLTNGAINTTANTTPAPFHHPAAQIREYLEAEDTWFPFSPEFINYVLALLVYSVRYPAVFWNTNKGFSFLFSLQLLANSFQNLLALGGISIMYKVTLLITFYLNFREHSRKDFEVFGLFWNEFFSKTFKTNNFSSNYRGILTKSKQRLSFDGKLFVLIFT